MQTIKTQVPPPPAAATALTDFLVLFPFMIFPFIAGVGVF